MRYTFGSLRVVEGLDVFALPDHMKFLFCEIDVCQDILPFVLFAKQEFIRGGESKSATFANETNETDLAVWCLRHNLFQ